MITDDKTGRDQNQHSATVTAATSGGTQYSSCRRVLPPWTADEQAIDKPVFPWQHAGWLADFG
jgi:hypothetical protein